MDACYVYEALFMFHRLCHAVCTWGSSSVTEWLPVDRVLKRVVCRTGLVLVTLNVLFVYRLILVCKSDSTKKQQSYHFLVIWKPLSFKNSLFWSQIMSDRGLGIQIQVFQLLPCKGYGNLSTCLQYTGMHNFTEKQILKDIKDHISFLFWFWRQGFFV